MVVLLLLPPRPLGRLQALLQLARPGPQSCLLIGFWILGAPPQAACALEGPLDVGALRAALRGILERHEVLR